MNQVTQVFQEGGARTQSQRTGLWRRLEKMISSTLAPIILGRSISSAVPNILRPFAPERVTDLAGMLRALITFGHV